MWSEMMKIVEMPKMGDTMEEGKILRWIKHEGDQVAKGESLAEVETDKVNIEIESFASGVLRKILVPEGESALIGAGIALIGAPDEPLLASSEGNSSVKTAVTKEMEKNAASAEGSRKILNEAKGDYQAKQTSVQAPPAMGSQGRIFISPIARRIAEGHQLDYSRIAGTGPNGRIIKLDIEAALAQKQETVAPSISDQLPVQEAEPVFIEAGETTEIPLTAMRRTIAKRLSQSMQTAPHFYITSVIDTGKLADLRRQINEYAQNEPNPVKVSFNDLIVKAVAIALVRVPQVNVSFAEDRLILKKQVYIGIAVALEQGLIVPVLCNADHLSVLAVARESQRLAELARTGKLRPEDFSGGTFTVSNLGMFDVESFTAVINPPESAILAVGSITPTPVVVDGQVVVRDRMKVTLSSDHRAIDGATAARFLQEVKRLLEEPFGLLL
jgi:pyruvate dehydrogenase E2 component (dihydrolipoyllysine-residue acetyltransferase)